MSALGLRVPARVQHTHTCIHTHTEERESRTEQTLLEHYNPPYLSSSVLLCFSACLSLIMISPHQSTGRSKQGQSVYNVECHTLHALRKGWAREENTLYMDVRVCEIEVFSQSDPPSLRSQGQSVIKLGGINAHILGLFLLTSKLCVMFSLGAS